MLGDIKTFCFFFLADPDSTGDFEKHFSTATPRARDNFAIDIAR